MARPHDRGRRPGARSPRDLARARPRQVSKMLEGVLAPGGTAPEATVPGYMLAGKTGTAQKPDGNGGYSKTKFVASFIGFAPARNPRLLVAVMVDEPQRRHLRRRGGGPGVREDRLVRPAVPEDPARIERPADRGLRTCGRAELDGFAPRLRPPMTLRELMGNGPEVEVSALAYSQSSVTAGDALFLRARASRATATTSRPTRWSAAPSRWCASGRWALGVPEVMVPDVRAAMAPAAARFYGDPTGELRVVGMTGTNGKTTTAFLVRALLEAAGLQTGLLGTVKSVVGGREEPVERTTPEAIDLQATFRRMLDAGDSACAMEVSSHALELGRAEGIHFACRVFTNLTQDHLDFHETMERYYPPSGGCSRRPGAPSVVNVDDDYGRAPGRRDRRRDHLRDRARRRLPRHRRALRPRGLGVHLRDAGRAARDRDAPARPVQRAERAGGDRRGARAGGRRRGDRRRARRGATRVPGRFEPVDEGQDFAVLVDYAHTPDSLENVLRGRARAHERAAARGVRRRRRPRPRQAPADGRARRGELADRVIVTSDNPRSEDPEAIVDEVLGGDGRRRRARGGPPRARSPARSSRREPRRRRGDRRQGPRAGPGVRGRAQGAVRRRDGGARGAALALGVARVIDRRRRLDRAGRGRRAGRRRSRAAPGPRRAVVDSREVEPGDLFVGPARASSADGGEFAAGGARGRRLGGARGAPRARGRELARASAALRDRGRRPAGRAPGAGARLAPRARLPAWSGSPARPARPRPRTSSPRCCGPRLSTHANRENWNTEIGLPLTMLERRARHRGAGARDGDARRGPDRRAGRRSPSRTWA